MKTLANTPKDTGPRQLVALLLSVCMALGLVLFAPLAQAGRIKEIASIEGVRSNQLTGFGLVVGLDGTGDQTTRCPTPRRA